MINGRENSHWTFQDHQRRCRVYRDKNGTLGTGP
jgi:hypothetical protein